MPKIIKLGDLTSNNGTVIPGTNSNKLVFCEAIPAIVSTDVFVSPDSRCPTQNAIPTSPKVYINGIPVVKNSDITTCGNSITSINTQVYVY
jgi:uncharacterized Zn-binding protein involved in type VI secretion